jgi:hypothetical protein
VELTVSTEDLKLPDFVISLKINKIFNYKDGVDPMVGTLWLKWVANGEQRSSLIISVSLCNSKLTI